MTADLIDLALADHYRVGFKGDPCRARSDIWDDEHPTGSAPARSYVTIADHHRLIAIYRVRQDGRLFRLTRWPSDLRYYADPGLQRARRRRQAELQKAFETLNAQPALSSVESDRRNLVRALLMLGADRSAPLPVEPDIDMDDLERTLSELDGL